MGSGMTGAGGVGLPASGGQSFNTTHWSVVLRAGDGDSPQAASALEQLCRTYWYPLYAYVRREGHTPPDAQDLTQEFFARLLARNSLAQVGPQKGKFRSFLLVALKHFLSKEWAHAKTLKRGGGHTLVPLDTLSGEDRYRRESRAGHRRADCRAPAGPGCTGRCAG